MHLTTHIRTQYPHRQASSFATRGYLLTLTVGKVGTRRLGVADCTELVVASFVNHRVSSIKTCSVNCATAPPFQIPNGVYRQSRRHRTVSGILSLPSEFFEGRPVQLWIDNSGAIGCLIKGYSGKADCAKLVNAFHFVVATKGIASLYIDYVPTDSNIADVPSRWHEMG